MPTWLIPAAIGFFIGYSGIADDAIDDMMDRSNGEEPNLVPNESDQVEITQDLPMEANLEQGGNMESGEPEGVSDIPRDETHEETMRMCVDCREESPALEGRIP